MRTKFVQVGSRYQASKACPWAAHIAQVCEGYMCFESDTDYAVWRNQK